MSEPSRNHLNGGHTRDSRSQSPRKGHSHCNPHRARSPHRQRHKHKQSQAVASVAPVALPYSSRQISKSELEVFRPMLGMYLDIQKQKWIDNMDEHEVKGRWKSFVGKWNRGELSEGWYDPTTFQKAAAFISEDTIRAPPQTKREATPSRDDSERPMAEEGELSDDCIGPELPGQEGRGSRMGPSIPSMQDLELKRELDVEDDAARRDDIRCARKIDRKEQKVALDELIPRADAGTRERQIEKKKEVNEVMKSFRERSPGATEVPDTELMGGGDGIEGYKKQKQEHERKKNERELRREEILRARTAEREERMQEYRTKEDATMSMLKTLAKQRFG